jgi:hypothetical protein
LCLPDSSGPSMAGQGCFWGDSGAAPRGAREALATVCQLLHCSCRPGGASALGGLGGGGPGRACSLAWSWGGCSLGARGQASLAWPQLGRSTRIMRSGLGRSSRHRDGGGTVRAAGRIHIGHCIRCQ